MIIDRAGVRRLSGPGLGALSCLVSLLTTALAQAPDPVVPEDIPPTHLKGDDFHDPKPKRFDRPAFPTTELGQEGWVKVSVMVDPKGKPFEVGVVESTGNPVFERAALDSMQHTSFEPATLNGTPIEGIFELRYSFTNPVPTHGAQPQFVAAFKAFEAAIKANDRAAADAAGRRLNITNLYESAYYGIAEYHYASLWGNEADQEMALSHALGAADHLPLPQRRSALLENLKLQLKRHDFAQVLQMSSQLRKTGIDKDTEAQLQSAVDNVQRLQKEPGSYTMSGTVPDLGAWSVWLFKRTFSASVSTGVISQIKLKCARRYVSFTFDPSLQYNVPESYGSCRLVLEGTPGTELTLTQSST